MTQFKSGDCHDLTLSNLAMTVFIFRQPEIDIVFNAVVVMVGKDAHPTTTLSLRASEVSVAFS